MVILICNYYEFLEFSICGYFFIFFSILLDLNNMYFIWLLFLFVILVFVSFGCVFFDLYLLVYRLEYLVKYELFLFVGIKKYVDV